MRIENIQFKNYKLLRDATLPLEPLTVIVGPNGSGKSSALEALRHVAANDLVSFSSAHTAGVPWDGEPVELLVVAAAGAARSPAQWHASKHYGPGYGDNIPLSSGDSPGDSSLVELVRSFRSFTLVPDRMQRPSQLQPGMVLSSDGATLAGALDQLRDRDPDAWIALNNELARWLPEFDAVLFDTPQSGMRAIALRTRYGRHKIAAADLSSGTLMTLGLLTIAYGETAPRLIGIEEPELGIHPRLLRNVRDALFEMAYPAENGSDAPPRQVIVTTHSPYLLDLFRDVPECVVVAERGESGVQFARLSDRPDIDDILSNGPLGDAWYSGVLGGVPIEPPPPTAYPVGVRDAA